MSAHRIPVSVTLLNYAPVPEVGCWLWLGNVNQAGYGIISRDGKRLRAHRLSWEQVNGPVPVGAEICHRCDTRSCINPEHLYAGTHRDNINDAMSRKRYAAGPSHPWNATPLKRRFGHRNANHKLSPDAANYARERNRAGQSFYSLAKELGVSATTISRLCRGVSYLTAEQMKERFHG